MAASPLRTVMASLSRRRGLLAHCNSLACGLTHCRRKVVTSSIEPPMILDEGYMERPGVLALIESTMYRGSWSQGFASTFPNRGVYYMSIDLFSCLSTTNNASGAESFSRMHNELASDLSSHAEVVLVARGPLPCLVAQYYLESLPLSGLIMVDPLLIPKSARNDVDSDPDANLQTTAQSLMQTLSGANYFDKSSITSVSNTEMQLIDNLQHDTNTFDRPLKLEAGCVPVRVMYTADAAYEEEVRHCAELTAARHTPDDDEGMRGKVFIQKISETVEGESTILETIYQLYDAI